MHLTSVFSRLVSEKWYLLGASIDVQIPVHLLTSFVWTSRNEIPISRYIWHFYRVKKLAFCFYEICIFICSTAISFFWAQTLEWPGPRESALAWRVAMAHNLEGVICFLAVLRSCCRPKKYLPLRIGPARACVRVSYWLYSCLQLPSFPRQYGVWLSPRVWGSFRE